MQRHFKTFYGRPRSHFTALKDQILRGRTRNSRRIDTSTQAAQSILAKLTPADQAKIEDYIQRRETDHGLAAMALLIDWALGEGLSPNVVRKELDEPWGEEFSEPYHR